MTRLMESTKAVCKNHCVTMTFIKVLGINPVFKTSCHVHIHLHMIFFPLEISMFYLFPKTKYNQGLMKSLYIFLWKNLIFLDDFLQCSCLSPQFPKLQNNSAESVFLLCPAPVCPPPLPPPSPPSQVFSFATDGSLIFLKLSGILF